MYSHWLWLNSKSMLVVPEGSWTRAQKRWRNDPAAFVSVKTPNVLRSLLLGGMLPVPTVGTAVSSLAPPPKESSLLPVKASVFVMTPCRIAGTDEPSGGASQSRLAEFTAALSTVRLALLSISKLLPARLVPTNGAAPLVPDRAKEPATRTRAVPKAMDARRPGQVVFLTMLLTNRGERAGTEAREVTNVISSTSDDFRTATL